VTSRTESVLVRTALAVASAAAQEAGQLLRQRQPTARALQRKGRANVTTDADLAAEALLTARLRAAFPEHALLAEEGGQQGPPDQPCWVIDPLDGTFNYLLGLPLYAISLALVVEQVPLVGVIYLPATAELFTATRGGGAFGNGTPLHGESGRRGREAVVGFDLGYHDARARWMLAAVTTLWGNIQLLRCLGSPVLGCAAVAAGRFDLYLHPYLAPWDFAAGWLLVEEAGARATDHRGQPLGLSSRSLVVGTPACHAQALEALAAAGPLPP
jgi:myo-inositol-1(or 4)-monophosphatase